MINKSPRGRRPLPANSLGRATVFVGKIILSFISTDLLVYGRYHKAQLRVQQMVYKKYKYKECVQVKFHPMFSWMFVSSKGIC